MTGPVIAAALAVLAVVGLTAGAIWLLAPEDEAESSPTTTSTPLTREQERERAEASAWLDDARSAFQGLGDVVPALVSATDEWLAGERAGAELEESLAGWDAVFEAALDDVRELEELDLAPDARALFELSARLYAAVPDVHRAAVEAGEDTDLARQVHLLGRRVRVLADRVYDRGYALVEPFLHREQDPNVTVNLPEEVPIWSSLDLAPGPPLDSPAEPYEGTPPLKEERRPEQARDDWIEALTLVNPPPGSDVLAAARAGDEEELGALAERLVAAAEALRDEPDPRGGREEHTRVRLGLLVHADAARAGQAGALGGGRAADLLERVAELLVEVGNDPLLWVEELPARSGEE